MIDSFAYLFQRISLAQYMVQYPIIFLPLIIIFFGAIVVYLVSGDRVREFLGKIARFLLFAYIIYNLLVALGVAAYLIYQNYV